MNYFIAPRSGEKSYKNFSSTIKHGVPYENIAPYLSEEGKSKLLNEEVIYSWGNRAGTREQWERMEYGDLVIFYAKGELVLVGDVYYKQHSPELALAMWPPDENGNPWEYTYFLRNLRYIKVPMRAFNWAAGYKSNFIIQGFLHLKGEHLQAIQRQYGSIEAFLGLFGTELSAEIPNESEKLYVNVAPDLRVRFRDGTHLRPKIQESMHSTQQLKKKIDHVASNKAKAFTGSKGEAIVLQEERKRLNALGRGDLAKRVKRISVDDDSIGYDILSYEENGAERYIEVKASAQLSQGLRFYMSANEMAKSISLPNYFVYFVDDINTSSPRVTPISCPLEGKLRITTDTYLLEGEVD